MSLALATYAALGIVTTVVLFGVSFANASLAFERYTPFEDRQRRARRARTLFFGAIVATPTWPILWITGAIWYVAALNRRARGGR